MVFSASSWLLRIRAIVRLLCSPVTEKFASFGVPGYAIPKEGIDMSVMASEAENRSARSPSPYYQKRMLWWLIIDSRVGVFTGLGFRGKTNLLLLEYGYSCTIFR